MGKYIITLFFVFIFFSCNSKKTDDADKAFKYWTQIYLDNSEVKPIEGRYWRSPHFTLEYEAYLKIVTTKAWREEFIKLNELEIDSTGRFLTDRLPMWFTPDSNYIKYSSKISHGLKIWQQGDTLFIYDIQL